MTCRNCKEPVERNYCPNCGQPAKLKRIDKNYLIQEIADFLCANKGLVYTIKKLLISPGDAVKQFIAEDRYRFMKPITFLIFTTLVFAFVNIIFGLDYTFIHDSAFPITPSPLVGWIFKNPRYTVTIMVLFVAFWLKIFFKKSGYNYFEILILMCFVSGITALFETVLMIANLFTHIRIYSLIAFPITIIYVTLAVGQFFGRKKLLSYVKVFISYILGFLTLGIIVFVFTIIENAIKTLI